MRYIIHTTVNITNTGQYRTEAGAEAERWKEQNFQTVLQTLGMRSNIYFNSKPQMINIKGDILGFNTNEIIKVWSFTFETERDNEELINFFKEDFDGVPYISGLDESMEQNFNVFVTKGPATNILFSIS
jgi:hypothetical protein